MFPLDNDPEDGIRYRNSETHSAFQNLHAELQIPSIAQGRAYALNFYYGKIIGTIHDVLVRRDDFKRQPDDIDKTNTYINHRGANHPEVVAFEMADDRQKGIDRNTIAMSQDPRPETQKEERKRRRRPENNHKTRQQPQDKRHVERGKRWGGG